MANQVFQANNLTKTYEGKAWRVVALDNVSLAADSGSVTAIVGPSGSGKTTLLNLLAGLDRPTSGDVRIGDQSLLHLASDATADFRRHNIGFVFQFFNLIPTMAARDNVAVPLFAEGLRRREADQRVSVALSEVGLDNVGDRRPGELSGGEQQRVAIARALVMKPRLILADEPTGNLDSVTGDDILQLLRRSGTSEGRALVIVTHSYQATAYADRVLVMSDGRVVDELTPEESQASPTLGARRRGRSE